MENKYRDDSEVSARVWADALFKRVLGDAVLGQAPAGSTAQRLKSFNDQFEDADELLPTPNDSGGAEESIQVSNDDRRTAAQIARAICAAVQIPAALQLLDRIKPVKSAEFDDMSGMDSSSETFNAVKAQVDSSLKNLLKEINIKSQQAEQIDTLCKKYIDEEPKLLIKLGEAANLHCRNVVTRDDERSLINYIAVCAHIRSICEFPVADHLDCGVGKKLGQLGHNFGCAKSLAGKLVEELAVGGIPDDCGPAEIPGVKVNSTMEHYALVKRLPYDAASWQKEVELYGKDGAAAIQAQVDHVASRFSMYQDNSKKGRTTTSVELLNRQVVTEIQQAAQVLADLMGGLEERGSVEGYDPNVGDKK